MTDAYVGARILNCLHLYNLRDGESKQ